MLVDLNEEMKIEVFTEFGSGSHGTEYRLSTTGRHDPRGMVALATLHKWRRKEPIHDFLLAKGEFLEVIETGCQGTESGFEQLSIHESLGEQFCSLHLRCAMSCLSGLV